MAIQDEFSMANHKNLQTAFSVTSMTFLFLTRHIITHQDTRASLSRFVRAVHDQGLQSS